MKELPFTFNHFSLLINVMRLLANLMGLMVMFCLILSSSISMAADSFDWISFLKGSWAGGFKNCVIRSGIAPKIFNPKVTMNFKAQGESLQGQIDLGAHGWAFSTLLDQLPDEDKTMAMKLVRADGVEFRIQAENRPDYLLFKNALQNPAGSFSLQLTKVESEKNVHFNLRYNNPLKFEQLFCMGTLEAIGQ